MNIAKQKSVHQPNKEDRPFWYIILACLIAAALTWWWFDQKINAIDAKMETIEKK